MISVVALLRDVIETWWCHVVLHHVIVLFVFFVRNEWREVAEKIQPQFSWPSSTTFPRKTCGSRLGEIVDTLLDGIKSGNSWLLWPWYFLLTRRHAESCLQFQSNKINISETGLIVWKVLQKTALWHSFHQMAFSFVRSKTRFFRLMYKVIFFFFQKRVMDPTFPTMHHCSV